MDPFRHGLSHLNGKTMEVEIVAVAIALEQLLSHQGGLLPHGHRLHRQHIGGSTVGVKVVVEIGDAVSVAGTLTRKFKAAKFTDTVNVEHPESVSITPHGEVAVDRPRSQQ